MENKDIDYWRLRVVLAEDYRDSAKCESNAGYSQLYRELAEFLECGEFSIPQTAVLNERV